jgi:hypothetical protein
VVVTEGIQPDAETIGKARDENITLLTSKQDTFTIVGKLAEMGI